MYSRNKYFNKMLFIIAYVVIGMTACNEDFPNILKDDYGTSSINTSESKVLLVVVDGIRGSILPDLDPVNLRELSKNSLYTNTSFGDNKVDTYTREVGLANIMTGVKYDVHGVSNKELDSVKIKNVPTFIQILKTNDPNLSSEAYTSDSDVLDILFAASDKKEKLDDDRAVINKAVSSLKTSNSDLFITHLNNPYKVGTNKSFESSDVAYQASIIEFDRQIKELVDAIAKREHYTKENWLIILTSSIGGEIAGDLTNDDKTAFGDSKQNTFTYFYSPKFGRKFIIKPNTNNIPFQGTALRVNHVNDQGNATSARLLDDTKLNIKSTDNVTITFFYRQNTTAWYWWTPIVQKWRNKDNNSVPGYIIYMAWDGKISMKWFRGSDIVSAKVNEGPNWNVITVVIDREEKKAKMFTNGKLSEEKTIEPTNLSNIEPFVIGRSMSENNNDGDVLICNFQYYNAAMTNEDVEKYAKLSLITEENNPYYENLIAYWPFYNDEGKKEAEDVTGRTGNLTLFNNVRWQNFSNQSNYIVPEFNDDTYRIVPNTVDIPLAIIQWFGVIPNEEWGLESKSWTFPYKVFEF